VAIVLSAIMSTIDSLLVIASSAITRDFYQKIFRPDLKDKDLGKLSRWVTLIMAFIALVIAMIIAVVSPNHTVFWLVIFGWSGIAASFCPVIILSLFWKGLSEKGAIAAMIAGFLCVPFFKFVVQEMDGIGPYFEKLDVLAPSFAISMTTAWIVSKMYSNKIDPEIQSLDEKHNPNFVDE
jgi:Na+/proline symporter